MATASPGFEFDRWVGDFSSSDGYIAFVVMDTDKTLTAYSVPSGSCCSLVVNVAAPGSGTVTLSPPQPPDGYAVGDNVTLTPAAAPGYLFSHWEGGLAGSVNPALIAISGNQSIVAVFNPKVEVVRSPSGGGTVSLAPEQPADGYAAGTAVTATAVAADGYKFDHWSGDLSGSETQESITVEGLVTITAHFAKPREFPWRWVGVGIAGLLLAVLAIWYVRGELRKG